MLVSTLHSRAHRCPGHLQLVKNFPFFAVVYIILTVLLSCTIYFYNTVVSSIDKYLVISTLIHCTYQGMQALEEQLRAKMYV